METEYHEYVYASGKLLREVITTTDAEGNVTTATLDFTYDTSGSPYSLTYNGTTYYYVVNLQGDVIRLVSGTGATVAEYEYDPYGRVISATGTMAEVNPLRYRGYYYDAETEFYYLQSRYYDPATCRFVNADTYTSTGQSFLGYNMFAYCRNDPVGRVDESGTADESAVSPEEELENLLDEYTDISPTGFAIDINTDHKRWDRCIKALGVQAAYDYMSEYLCQKYWDKYGLEFLFTEECVSYEIEYHVDAYMCMMGYSGYKRNFTTWFFTKSELVDRCGTVNISTKDIDSFLQSTMFGYKKGIRRRTDFSVPDPHNPFTTIDIN